MSCDCSNTPSNQPPQTPPPSARRGFMLKFGIGLMGIGGAIASIPLVGYAITPALRKYKIPGLIWVAWRIFQRVKLA